MTFSKSDILNRIEEIERDFYELAHIRITVFDSELNELVSYPEECAPFCRIMEIAEVRMIM